MSFTNAQLGQKIADLIEYWSNFNTEYSNWLGGTVGGGPNNDGEYPLTDYTGNETLVKAPAQLQDDVDNITSGATAQANAAAASAAAALTSETNAAASEAQATSDAAAAAASAAAAAVDAGEADSSATVATTQANLATDRVGYAEEWANAAYNTLVSVAAGGNGTDEYSARHWAEHAASLNPGASPQSYLRSDVADEAAGAITFAAMPTIKNASGASQIRFNSALDADKWRVGASGDGTDDFIIYDYANTTTPVKIDDTTGDVTLGAALAVTGAVTGSNLNVSNWDTAYGWGDHSTQNYAVTTGDTFTGVLTFEATPTINMGTPAFFWRETDAPVDEGNWRMRSANGQFTLHAGNDAESTWTKVFHVNRTGTTLDEFLINAPVTVDSLASTGAVTGSNLNVSNWDTAYGWGDHAAADYVKLGTTTQTDNYTYFNRTSASIAQPTLHVAYVGANGAGMKIGEAPSLGSTAYTDELIVGGGYLYKDDGYLDIKCGAGTVTGLRMASTAGTQYGYFYGDGNGIGILHDGGGWAVQVHDTTHEIELHDQVIFTAARSGSTPTFELQSTNPQWFWYETDAPAGEKCWNMGMAGGDLYLRTMTDARANDVDVLRFINVGGDPSRMQIDTGIRFMTSSWKIEWVNANTYITEGTDNQVRLGTDHGYMDIGPQNTSYCHLATDIGNGFYTAEGFHFNGQMRRYNKGAYLHHASSSYAASGVGAVTFSTSAASGGSSGDIWFQYT